MTREKRIRPMVGVVDDKRPVGAGAVLTGLQFALELKHLAFGVPLKAGNPFLAALAGTPAGVSTVLRGDVLVIETDDAAGLRAALPQGAAAQATALNGTLRVECENGQALIAALMNSHADRIRELRMHKPSLARTQVMLGATLNSPGHELPRRLIALTTPPVARPNSAE